MTLDITKVSTKTSLNHCFANHNSELEGLDEFFNELGEHAEEVSINANQYLFRENDKSDYVYILISGAAMLERSTTAGSRQVFAFLYTGNLLGLSEHSNYSFSAKALTNSTAIKINHKTMQSIFDKFPAVAQKYHQKTGRILSLILDQLFIMGQKSAHQRLAHFLLDMINKLGRGTTKFMLPMSRQDIADYLGMSLETASRGFSRLKAEGHIEIESNYQITIINKEALEAFIAE
ncbi:Crp/Fnr family transcriptional regulator [Paraferrimonas sp. SM1919]|uniref:Crp/Fnr family transcriptional regulator n=1 Tax=Paraferrimonas sp. SM1919 TaxID=2662263 RepID=UPI0013D59042|nr:helix-turn-helix domain-containing protein [Paraferrimonas sp. SM1919]